MTTPSSYPDPSNPVTAIAGPSARPLTEPVRELSVLALLAGNGVFLALGFSGLFFVIDRWASDFALRCVAVYGDFVGPLSLGLPLLAMILTTHVTPILPRTRAIMITVLVELSTSALFGAITYLGAFAHDLSSVRATIEGLLGRSVWLAFLVIAGMALARVWRGLYPPAKPRPAGYTAAYPPPTYGRPYPGQPLYPHGTYPVTGDEFHESADPFSDSGWPVVPPPPRPAPLVVETAGDRTMRISALMPTQLLAAGDATQRISLSTLASPAAAPVSPAEPVVSPAAPTTAMPSNAAE